MHPPDSPDQDRSNTPGDHDDAANHEDRLAPLRYLLGQDEGGQDHDSGQVHDREHEQQDHERPTASEAQRPRIAACGSVALAVPWGESLLVVPMAMVVAVDPMVASSQWSVSG